jgi:ATP-dependent metalloprotease FtsH
MDDKSYRREGTESHKRRHKLMKNYRYKMWKFSQFRQFLRFLKASKKHILTGVLLLGIVVLLYGLASQLPPVSTSVSPPGMTTVSYSAFLQDVKIGDVQAVVIQGNGIEVLLFHPLGSQQSASAPPPDSSAANADYQTWLRMLSGNGTILSSDKSTVTIDPARMIYTRMPASGDTSLMSLLITHHVTVDTQGAGSSIDWQAVLWRLAPLVFFVLLLLVWLGLRSNSNRSFRSSMGERMTQMSKSRARRFGPATEKANIARPGQRRSASPGRSVVPVRNGQVVKSGTKHISTEPPVTFNDVAGIDEVRAELEEIVQFLRNSERYDRLGARIPRGALLIGPPGTGKTLLAKAVAGEAGVPFFSMSASEFVEMFVGVGASRVRDLFQQARQSAPCVVFIDEIDAVGRKRTMRVTNNDERDQTLNQLLVELDGFDPRQAVVVLAATNRVDILDKALLRPGRFDRRITVSLPDRAGREAILKVHTRKIPLHEDVSLGRLARMSTGMTGADLANLVNEAALSAARRQLDAVNHECFEEALARVQLGALRPLVMSEQDRSIIAYHEGGHALVAYHLPQADTVNRVTILPRGQSLGVTQFTPEEDRYNYSREMLMTKIAVGLGGRAAEELTFGPDRVTTGAENDFQAVTDLARRMVTRWGMSEQVGVICADYQPDSDYSLNMHRLDPDALPSQSHSLALDEHGQLQTNGELRQHNHQFAMAAPSRSGSVAMSALVDAEVQNIINEGYVMARTILSEHADQLKLLADTLLEHEQLDRAQFEALLK